MKYNIAIVDDHKMFLDGISTIIENNETYHILFKTQNGQFVENYLKTPEKNKVDLLITDISMPGMDGITLVKNIRKRDNQLKILVVSMLTEYPKITKLMEYGIQGYIPKNAEQKELIQAISVVLQGGKYFSDEIQHILQSGNKVHITFDEQVKLTRREIDVITLIAKEYTTQEIADSLFISKHTVESYRKKLIAKLQVKNIAGLVKYALKMGFAKF